MDKKFYPRLAIILGLLLLVIGVYTSIYFAKQNDGSKHVYSHRGASGEEVEHTFAAYDLAIAYGSKFIEQDLVTSKDGTLFVSHDLSAKKITGVDKLFSDMTDQEIKKLRTENHEAIHTLQEVFDKYQDKPTYVIELKENDKQTNLFKQIIKENQLEKSVIVQASAIKPLLELAKTFPDMPRLLLVETQEELNKAVTYDEVDIVSANKSLMNEDNAQLVKQANKQFNVWTINSVEEIEKAIKLDVDTYFTNFTAKALLLEKQHR